MLLVVAATHPEVQAVTAGPDVTTLVCGVGPVDAAAATSNWLASSPDVRAVLHVGIAGCREASSCSLLDVVVGTEARYCDTSSRLVEQVAPADPDLLRVVSMAVPDAARMPIGTSAEVGGTAGCDVEAMEGFAVLRASELAGVPAIEVRVIANEIEQADRSRWDFTGALDRLSELLPVLVEACRGYAHA